MNDFGEFRSASDAVFWVNTNRHHDEKEAQVSNDRHRIYPGAVRGSVAITLRLEGAVALALAVLAYRATGASWLMFAVLFLTPDLSMLGYMINKRVGAWIYNFGHSYLTPAAIALLGFVMGISMLGPIALIWAAHIGFDRLVGYGLKYAAAFGATHLSWKDKRDFDVHE
jgi:hypothetical protein